MNTCSSFVDLFMLLSYIGLNSCVILTCILSLTLITLQIANLPSAMPILIKVSLGSSKVSNDDSGFVRRAIFKSFISEVICGKALQFTPLWANYADFV